MSIESQCSNTGFMCGPCPMVVQACSTMFQIAGPFSLNLTSNFVNPVDISPNIFVI